ncbi:MAG: hypothetical protein EA397_15000 [Deltaproteobacteria bacterium]|nr:MAG: hypothetical protein EA397_15000 [Deltaproteobacteria bacterium]
MIRYIVLLLLCASCTIAVENFPDRGATAVCDKLLECDELELAYNNCHRNWRAVIEAWIEGAQLLGYEYDPSGARSCVRRVEDLSCDDRDDWDLTEHCEEVFR